MNRLPLFLLLSCIMIVSFVVTKVAYAFFVDTAASTTNTFTAAAIFPSQTPTPTPGPGSVVINEIMWMGSSLSDADEWVELRNTTSNQIDLSNWTIDNLGVASASITIPAGKTIPANGFFLLSDLADTASTSILNVTPDIVNSSIALTNTGEQLILRNSSSTIMDTANGLGVWLRGINSTPNQSMERNASPGDGTLSTSWHNATTQLNLDSTTDSATPKAANSL